MKKKNIIRSDFFTLFEAKQTVGSDGINSVLVISEGPAKGHFCVEQNGKLRPFNPDDASHEKLEKIPIYITAQTLAEVAQSGNSRSEVKAKLDHGETVRDTFGGYSNFRVEGTNVYADLKFLEGTPHRSFVEGIASRFADEFGNSIDFQSAYTMGKDATGKKIAIANCLRLGSIDLVDSPAATNSLFEEIESPPESMPLSPEDLTAIGDMINKAVATATGSSTIEERLAKLEAPPAEKSDEDKKKEEDAKKKDDESAQEKMNALIEKAALKVANDTFTKLSTGFVKIGEAAAPTAIEDGESFIATQLSTGCANRASAIARMAKDKPDLYHKFRS